MSRNLVVKSNIDIAILHNEIHIRVRIFKFKKKKIIYHFFIHFFNLLKIFTFINKSFSFNSNIIKYYRKLIETTFKIFDKLRSSILSLHINNNFFKTIFARIINNIFTNIY